MDGGGWGTEEEPYLWPDSSQWFWHMRAGLLASLAPRNSGMPHSHLKSNSLLTPHWRGGSVAAQGHIWKDSDRSLNAHPDDPAFTQ